MTAIPSTKRRAALSAALAALAALALSGCGLRYYSATVFGYVREASVAADGSQAGINSAEVLVFLEDPAANPEATPSVRTSTMTSGGQDGYWSHKIMWGTRQPAFRDEGDSGTFWVRIMRTGYFPRTTKVTGVLSDASNPVPTIELTRVLSTKVRGRVVNGNGVGVNGVRVVLDLESTVAEADLTASTSTDQDGVVGVFVFSDVAWNDSDSVPVEPRAIADGVATENIRLYVDDPAWYSDTNDPRYPELQTAVIITTDADTDLSATPITARSATFTAPILKGRVAALAAPSSGINGVTIAVDIPITAASPDATVISATISGDPGWYQFENLTWTNNRPNHSAAGALDDVVAVRVYLNDGAWYSSRDADAPIELTVTSAVIKTVDEAIAVGDATFTVPSVKGRVLLEGLSSYENGVGIRLELASSGTILGTTTTRVGAEDGVFEFTNVEWVDTKPERDGSGALAETEQVRLSIQDADYTSETDAQSPLIIELAAGTALDLSASALSVSRRNFSVPKVSGSVVTDLTSAGVAGITVVLDLQSTPDNARDLTATTDQNGDFVFSNVRWTDDTPDVDAATDTEDIKLTIENASYETAVALPLKTLTSGADAGTTGANPAWTVRATRTERWTYSVTVSGTCSYRNLTASPVFETTVAGATVTIAVTDIQGVDLKAKSPIVVQTSANGTYSTTVDWSREPEYVPAPEAAANGGDKLAVTVSFAASGYTFPDVVTNLLSWSGNNIVNGLDTDP